MNKIYTVLLLAVIFLTPIYSQIPVGSPVPYDVSWTDDSGYSTSIFEETANGNAVMLFFGQFG